MYRPFWSVFSLTLLVLPILHLLWIMYYPPSRLTANIVVLYFAMVLSGPLLILYAFLMRTWVGDKVFSTIAYIIGGVWLIAEAVFLIKTYWL